MRRTAAFAGLPLVAALTGGCGRPPAPPVDASSPTLLEPQEQAFARYAGSASCRECHTAIYDEWAKSNHGLAEREWRADLDAAAFDPARTVVVAGQTSSVHRVEGGGALVAPGLSGTDETFTAERVIGHYPLRQYLAPAPGGRWQATELAWDPEREEWFNVYGEEGRRPGEWGHWTGRGMIWNTMCAACHNTRVRKNYDEDADRFHTAMAETTVSCESCHGPALAHVNFRRTHPDPSRLDPHLPPLNRDQVTDTCAACHSRRTELTGDPVPGDGFHDHHLLTVPDLSDLYYADGQVRDELYEYGSFLGSKMHAAGVRCVDCHNPHAAGLKFPGDAVCMQCHAPGTGHAPVINPLTHTFHRPESAGARCTACHMPVTTYMQRDPRHDHGFTIPDPALTLEHGVPNACNRCHTDQTAAWADTHVRAWYGEKMERHTRGRARLIARARAGDVGARRPLVEQLKAETNAYWRASTLRVLEQWLRDPSVATATVAATRDPHALVRAHACQVLGVAALAGDPAARGALLDRLADPVRAVRISAAWGLRDQVDPASLAGRELLHSLAHNADQPAGQMQQAAWKEARGDRAAALAHLRKAAEWDPYSPAIRHDFAIALSLDGKAAEALQQMIEAVRLEPANADYTFALALAYAEAGGLDNALAYLEQATRLRPDFARAWYNLGLLRNQRGDTEGALTALTRAEAAEPAAADAPYARATILLRLGRTEEARAAAREALRRDPAHAQARALLGG
jgi:tetratricopeptide (TPR) repeat protein